MAVVERVISSGHSKYVSGGNGILNEVTEARRVVDQVAKYLKELKETVEVYHDNTTRNQRDNVNGIVAYHNKFTRQRDYSVHFNAGGSADKPVGVEVLYYSDSMKAEAAKLSAAIAKASGLKDRGAKKRTDLGFLKGTEKPALLIEVCFVDSKVDAKLYKENFYGICEAIAETISGKQIKHEEVQTKPESKPAVKPSGTKYQVIAGTFTDKKNAENMASKLKKAGFDSYVK
jgi:N-acetylmuramoyl-L-alanine amidase